MNPFSFRHAGVFLCLLTLLAVSLPSRPHAAEAGAQWVFVGFTRYRDALFMDRSRLTSGAGLPMQVWSRITPSEKSRYYRQIHRDLRTVGKAPEEFKYIEMLNEINCIDRKIRYLKVIYFRHDGTVIHATQDDRPLWKTIHYGSLWDSLLSAVCRQQGG